MNHALVRDLYAALARGDRDGVATLLAPDFAAAFAAGLPHAIGGTRHGLEAIDRGWWAIGRHFAIRAEPHEWIDCTDGRLLVTGHYRGRARATGHPVDAAFAHLWSERDGRLASLEQFTDTVRWAAPAA